MSALAQIETRLEVERERDTLQRFASALLRAMRNNLPRTTAQLVVQAAERELGEIDEQLLTRLLADVLRSGR